MSRIIHTTHTGCKHLLFSYQAFDQPSGSLPQVKEDVRQPLAPLLCLHSRKRAIDILLCKAKAVLEHPGRTGLDDTITPADRAKKQRRWNHRFQRRFLMAYRFRKAPRDPAIGFAGQP